VQIAVYNFIQKCKKNANYMKDKIINFFEDIYKEMKKVSWPKKEELIDSTKVVVVTMLLSATLVYLIDKGISELLKAIF